MMHMRRMHALVWLAGQAVASRSRLPLKFWYNTLPSAALCSLILKWCCSFTYPPLQGS
jgi:hypothetical protein